jgi:aromatic ring-opening dioxygenase catalytic subunit (LigB family)
MGQVVFVAGMSHAPHITAFPDRAEASARERLHSAMRRAGEALRAARADVLVVLSADHFTNLFVDKMPAFCVGLAASYEGPVEDWINIPLTTFRGDAAFARLILDDAFSNGIEPAFSSEIKLEHGLSVPLSFLLPKADLPIVPVLQNCMAPPLPTLRRCYEFGRSIRRAAEHSDKRVAIVGTGGLSHSPGAPEAGFIDEDFDRQFLDKVSSASPLSILDIPNARIDAAGFGTWEVRQWATALGAADGSPAAVLAYEPIGGWETGCAVAVFHA